MSRDAARPFSAVFRFYEELNDFLPPQNRKQDLGYAFNGKPSVKDAIEAQGIPHPEVDLIVVNGTSVGFEYHLKDGDRVAVYPVFEGIDITPAVRLREKPLREPKFILDVHLGKLARYMRLLGFDVYYRTDYDDPEIVRLGVEQGRAILTRDRKLLHARVITHGYALRSMDAEEQLKEVIRRFDLKDQIDPFSRCLSCNAPVEPAAKEKVLHLLEPKTKKYFEEFHSCTGCGKVYWQGSHFGKLQKLVERITNSINTSHKDTENTE